MTVSGDDCEDGSSGGDGSAVVREAEEVHAVATGNAPPSSQKKR